MSSYSSPLIQEIRRIQEKTKEIRSRELRAALEAKSARRKREQELIVAALPADHRANLKQQAPAFVVDLFKAGDSGAKKSQQDWLSKTVTAPWEFDWAEVHPSHGDMTYYGPDKATGRLGGKLYSSSAGDFQAITSVGMSYWATQTCNMTVRAYFTVENSYLGTGGIGPFSAEASIDLGISVFENDVKFAITMENYARVSSSSPVPPFPDWDVITPSGTADRAVHFPVQAGHLYTFYFECVHFVGTWGPGAAHSETNVIVNYARALEP